MATGLSGSLRHAKDESEPFTCPEVGAAAVTLINDRNALASAVCSNLVYQHYAGLGFLSISKTIWTRITTEKCF